MTLHRARAAALGVALTLGFAAASLAQRPDTSQASLFAAREQVWRDYFGNGADLARALTPDFIGIQAGDTAWTDRAATLAGARASAERGSRLVSLQFPRNSVERHGNVAVIHSRYLAELDGAGGRGSMRGNITEVFVWTGSRWVHTSWHMDFDRP
jgi:hypothetical protein